MSWKKFKLGEILSESRIPSENPDPDRRITVRLNVLGVEKRPLENEKPGATKQFIRKAGQFIYGKQNFHKGAFGIIPDELDGYESSADLPAFDVRKDCLPEWIFYFFKQGGYYLELSKIARGVATQRIHPEQIYELEIPLPDIKTQKNIIVSIKAIEENIEKLNNELSHQLTLVEQLNQAILQEAVQGKLVPQDPNDEPASELLKRIKAEKAKSGKKEKPLPPIKPEEIPFEIPENWVWCRLGEIINMIYGDSLTKEQCIEGAEYPVFGSNGIVGYFNKYLTDKRTIVVGRKGSAGALNVCHTPSWTTDVAYYIEESEFLNFEFTYYLLKSLKLEELGKGIKPGVNRNEVYNIPIPLPPLSEQKRIVAEIEKQFAKTKQLKEHIIANQQATEQLLKALLHQAFEVKEIEEASS